MKPLLRSRARRRLALLALSAMALLGWDLSRAAERQLSARALLVAIDGYQAVFSPRMDGLGVRCRFRPTCSHYGEAVIRRHGTLVGGWKTATRVLRCGPWTPAGTYDPPS